MSGRIDPLSIACPLAAVAALAPGTAEACPGYYVCDYADAWVSLELADAVIPVDGVLVLQGKYPGTDADNAFAAVELEVTRDGQPIAGALEQTAAIDVLVWRPADPWQPGDYQAVADVAPHPENCQVQTPLALPFVVDPGSGPAALLPEFVVDPKFSVIPDISLGSLACCLDAQPPVLLHEDYLGCPAEIIDFDLDRCTPTTATGRLALFITGAAAAQDPFGGQILNTLNLDGEPFAHSIREIDITVFPLYAPTCVSYDATDLASGEVVHGEEQCFGQENADSLGVHPIEMLRPLSCSPLEQCAVVDDTWDKTMCEPFDVPGVDTTSGTDTGDDAGTPAEDVPTTDAADDSTTEPTGDPGADPTTDDGCGCTTDAAPAPALLALAGLLTLRRRRVRAG